MARSTLFMAAAAAAALAGGAWAQPSPPPPTDDFIKAAAASDQFEMLEGQVAVVEGRSPRVRAFARQMIQEHARTTLALADAAKASGAPPPPMGLSGDQARLLSALQGLSGPSFDQTYLRHQVLGHQSALVVEQAYASGGADPRLRQVAQSTVPVIQHHLEMARRLQATSGGAS